MPVDDPGWGDFTPLPGETPPAAQKPAEPPAQPQPPAQAPVPRAGGGGPGGAGARIALAALVVLALAAGAYFLFFSGDDSGERDGRPAVAATDDDGDESPADVTPSHEETPGGDVTPDDEETPGGGDAPTTGEYIVEADKICRRFTPDIVVASQDNDIPRLVKLYKKMVGRLSLQVLPEGEDGDLIQSMLDDYGAAADALPEDYELALSFASAAQTTAFQMGFEDCSDA